MSTETKHRPKNHRHREKKVKRTLNEKALNAFLKSLKKDGVEANLSADKTKIVVHKGDRVLFTDTHKFYTLEIDE